jgi:hypothetical protein
VLTMSTQCAADRPVRRRRSPGVVRRAPDPGPELCLALGVTGRLDLLNVLQSQLELFLWQGFSPPPMSLQLLDDLAQPLAFRPLSQQHRLEQVRIVRQGFGGARHQASQSRRRRPAMVFEGNSQRGSSPRRAPSSAETHAPAANPAVRATPGAGPR